jgi:hypothetical protein
MLLLLLLKMIVLLLNSPAIIEEVPVSAALVTLDVSAAVDISKDAASAATLVINR